MHGKFMEDYKGTGIENFIKWSGCLFISFRY